MVGKYNNTYHRSIKLTPSDARNPANYQHIHNALYAKLNARKATSPKFHVGDVVLKTSSGDLYEPELQFSAQENFHIERVLKKKKNGKKWKGYSDAFNSWVRITDLEA